MLSPSTKLRQACRSMFLRFSTAYQSESKKSRRLPSKSLRAACVVDIALVHGQLAARIGSAARQALPADHFRCRRQGNLSVAAADADNRVRLRRGVDETRIVR